MKEIKIRIRTTWNGQVGIRDKYIEQAKQTGKDLYLVAGNEAMTIKNAEIDASIISISKFPFKDYFSKDVHRLIYFKWNPDKNLQQKLFK